MHPSSQSRLLAFDRVRVLNLPHRTDRRRAATKELVALGEAIDGDRVAFFPSIRPTAAAGFDTVGTHGFFLSHLAALREANRDGVASLLILEDDVAFSASEIAAMSAALGALEGLNWDLFYGGSPTLPTASPLTALPPAEPLMLAHFIGFSRPAIERLVPYLEAILKRSPGRPDGGPMHVDGAYSWFRRANPDLRAFAATPMIAHQRASATDIHTRRGLDRIPMLRSLLLPARAVKTGYVPVSSRLGTCIGR